MSFIFARKTFNKIHVYNEDDMELISSDISYSIRVPHTVDSRFTTSKKAYLYRGKVNGLFAVKYRNYEDNNWYYDAITDNEALNLLIAGDDNLHNIIMADELFGPFDKA